jgi:hypothetical protein
MDMGMLYYLPAIVPAVNDNTVAALTYTFQLRYLARG